MGMVDNLTCSTGGDGRITVKCQSTVKFRKDWKELRDEGLEKSSYELSTCVSSSEK